MGMITTDQYAAFATTNGLPTNPAGLADAIEKATAEAVTIGGRVWVPSPLAAGQTETRTYRGNGDYILYIEDALSIASVAQDGVQVTDWRGIAREAFPIVAIERAAVVVTTEPRVVTGQPAARWTNGVEIAVTGRFGYSELAQLPADVIEATCALTALRLIGGVALWTAAQNTDDAKITVLNVTIDNSKPNGATAALAEIRTQAERTLRGYRRIV